ncbi:hypothetical protein RhiirB3_396436 [Rhizophagus irregularis]|nr:hypothetical protein RhiirB3_396436 [Rhizophagus irregularis]
MVKYQGYFDWRELNKTWIDRFLGAAKKLTDKKIFADLTKKEFKKRKQENKENIDSEGRRKSTKRCLWQYPFLQYLIVPYPSIRSWATNGIISPDQRDKYYYADPAKTNTELLNSILEGKFVALHGPRSSGKTTRVYRIMQQLTEPQVEQMSLSQNLPGIFLAN